MKSSILHRSNLSKERKAFLEELRSQNEYYDVEAPNIYKRTSKQEELDTLWKAFKVNQKEQPNPGVYLTVGFIVGAISMFIMTALLSFGVNSDTTTESVLKPMKKSNIAKEVKIIPAEVSAEEEVLIPEATTKEVYTIKEGDTLAGIIVRFYGRYDVSKIEKIKEANNMSDVNKLRVGDTITIPLD